MKKIIVILIIALITAISVSAADITKYKNKKAYVNSSVGYVSQEPYRIKSKDVAKIEFDKKIADDKFDMCFRFQKKSEYFRVTVGDKKVERFGDYIKCVKNFNGDLEKEFNLSISYLGYGESKYDILFLPRDYGYNFDLAESENKLIVLDPFVLGQPSTNMTFNTLEGTYNSTFAEDVGQYGRNMTVNQTTYSLGYIERAYEFDGSNSNMNVTNGTILLSDKFSIAFWFNKRTDDQGMLFDYRPPSGANGNVLIQFFSNALEIRISDNNTDSNSFLKHFKFGTNFNNNTWYHVIAVYNSSDVYLYTNGTNDVGTVVTNNSLTMDNTTDRYLTLGSNFAKSIDYNGFIDEFLIYDKYALNFTEAADLYNSYNYSSITVEFRDEISNAIITHMNATIVNNGTTNTTGTTSSSILIKDTNTLEYSISAAGSLYPTRTREVTYGIPAHNLFTMYLLQSNVLEGVLSRFQTLDDFDNTLTNVSVTLQTTVGGSTVTVDEGSTDGTGLINFWTNGAYSYTATFVKTGYKSVTLDFTPATTDIITIRMESGADDFNVSFTAGLTFDYSPKGAVLGNSSKYNLSINMSSLIWNITSCNLTITGNSSLLSSQIGTFNITNCNATLEIDTAFNESLTSTLYYELNFTSNSTFVVSYRIENLINESLTLQTVIDDIDAFAEAGFDNFSRMVLGFLLVFIITAIVSGFAGTLNEPHANILVFLCATWLISYLGWFRMTYPGIVALGRPLLAQYMIFYVLLLAGAGYLIARQIRN